MTQNTGDLAIVFIIVVYLLTGVVVSLTVFYFSGSRPKNRGNESKNKASGETNTLTADKETVSLKKRQLGGTRHFLKKSKTLSPQTERPQNKKVTENEPNISENVITKKKESPNEKVIGRDEVELKGNSVQPIVSPLKSDTKSNDLSLQEQTMKGENPVPTKITDVPNSQGDSIIPNTVLENGQNLETEKNTMAQEVKPEAVAASTVPLIKIVNENSLKTVKDDKSNNSSTGNDFSQLFTDEDVEENEATKLAKEMNDIDTGDILEGSRDLVNQLKRSRS
jgi:hypothetical protein